MHNRRRQLVNLWTWFIGPICYLILALIVTWPLVNTALFDVVIGVEPAYTVPYFNTWTIWWNADRAMNGFSGYWNAPIFFPEENTFAYSEPQPATLLVAPVLWMIGSHALAMNLYLWLSLALNGWFAERFLRTTIATPWIAVGGGISTLLLPLVHWQIGVVQLVPMWGTIWLWWAFLRLCNQHILTTSWKSSSLVGAEIGFAMTASWYCCVHHGLSLAILMIACGWMLGRKLLRIQFLAALVGAILIFSILCGPMLWHLGMMTRKGEFIRDKEIVAALSCMPGDYLSAYGHSLVTITNPQGRPGWLMSPGLGKLALGALGVALGLGVARRNLTIFLSIIVTTAFLLSLGDNLQILQWKPWWLLVQYVPGFAQIRNVFRFGYFFQAAMVLLATSAVDMLWTFSTKGHLRDATIKIAQPWYRRGVIANVIIRALIVVAAVSAWLDPWPPNPGLVKLDYSQIRPAWIAELAKQMEAKNGAALCLPMAYGDGVKDYEVTAKWMFASTYHGVPLVNGYSGFFPERYFRLRNQIRSSGMNANVLEQLVEDGVSWVVIDRKQHNTWWGEAPNVGAIKVVRIFGDGSDVDIYKLEPERR